jgi:hypothetical protein
MQKTRRNTVMSVLQVLEMVSIDGVQFEEVMEGVGGVDESGMRVPISAEALLPAPLIFELFGDGAVPVGTSAFILLKRDGQSPLEWPMSQRWERELLEAGGARSKSEWRRQNWGMSDDFFDVEEWGAHMQNYGKIRFRTRDGVPRGFYEALSEKFIDPQFQIRWWDEERGGAGLIVYQMGHQLEDLEYHSEAPEYAVIRDQVAALKERSSEAIPFPPHLLNF